jgi:hypothetical protein
MLYFVIGKIEHIKHRTKINKRQAYNTIQKAKILNNTGPPKIGVNHGADDW